MTARRSGVAAVAGLLAAACITCPGQEAEAAYPTHVLSAAEPNAPWPELNLGAQFRYEESRGQITREWFATDGLRAQDVRELEYSESTQYLDLKARIGLYHDLELRITAPVVLSYESRLGFAEGVGPSSTVYAPGYIDAGGGVVNTNADDPGYATRYPITGVPSSRQRSGMGDIRFGLAWSPVQETKDLGWPTLTLIGEITTPTGDLWEPGDVEALPGGKGGNVGRGMTVVDLSIGLSKRSSGGNPSFDPYFVLGTKLPIASGAQLDRGMEPPISARAEAGTAFVVHADPTARTRYALDLGILMRFIGSGRTYSPLSDYLPNFDQTRVESGIVGYDDYANPDNYRNGGAGGVSCSGVRLDRAARTQVDATPGVACGELNQVDEHLHLGGQLALHLQPSRYFFLRAGAKLAYITDHLLTNERAGTDTDPADAPQTCSGGACFGRINASNAAGQDERSPYYDPRYDAPGRRFRLEEAFTWSVFVEGMLMF